MSMSRTISVFEHSTLKVGPPPAGSALSQSEFEALARFNDERERRFFSLGHHSITFRQYVGYLQVGSLGIEVLPKPDKRAALTDESLQWRDMLLEMLRVGLGLDLLLSGHSNQSLERPSLIELVVAHLLLKVEQLVREGLAKGYREEEGNGPTFRGRIVFAEQVRQNHSRADRCYVRYQVYDRDSGVNRLLRAALQVAARAPVSAPLRARTLALLPSFDTARHVAAKPELFDRIVFTRSTERYRGALVLARMLVEGLSPALTAGKVPVFSLLFDMNMLWERYIGVLCQRARPAGVRVTLQNGRPFWKADASASRPIRPDIVVSLDGRTDALAVLDTKWKLAELRGPSDDDLKQMFAYNELFGAPQSFLLYPTTALGKLHRSGTFFSREHRCTSVELMLKYQGRARTTAIIDQLRALMDVLLAPACSHFSSAQSTK
jgi:5-methylcytosine-specific restriction enzyme subunit McrC